MALHHSRYHACYCLRKSEVRCQCGEHHHRYGKDNYHHATVIVSGVSLTKVREHGLHDVAATELIVLPATTVTDVGAVADAIGIVNSCESGCVFVQQQPPLHGT